jgi:ABC-2 type transport system permease protein
MSSLAGTFKLLRFIIRRDRLWLSFWLLGIIVLSVFFAPMLPNMIGDQASSAGLVETMKNPAMVAMTGIVYGDPTALGSMYTQLMMVWTGLVVAIMNIMLVNRHTRKDEEEGRQEIMASLPVGRNANLLAVLLVSVLANLVYALLTALIIPTFGLEGMGFAGSAAFAFGMAACGLVFAAITALFCQIFSSSRAVLGFSLVVLGISYLLRAIGDIQNETMSRISPLGLMQRMQPYVENLIWPLLILLVEAALFFTIAFILSQIRDNGAGLIPARSGRRHASALLRGEWSLAWRQVRGTVIAWVVTVFVFSAAYGSVMGDMGNFLSSNELYQSILGVNPALTSNITNPVVATLMMIMSLVACIPVIVIIHRLHAEENRGRIEQVFAKSVSRSYFFAGYFVIAAIIAVVLQLVSALGFYLMAASTMPEGAISLAMVLKVTFNYLPGLLLFAGLAAFLVGISPRLSFISWIYLVVSFLIMYMGKVANLPEQSAKLSPFGILPQYPVQDFNVGIWVALVGVGLALGLAGLLIYRKRDIRT